MGKSRSKSILVVDAATCASDYHAALFRMLGHDTVQISNADQALERVLTDPPDLVVLELDMPTLDGVDLISWIRRCEGKRRTPILVLTIRDDLDSRARCAAHGCAGYLRKPTCPLELTQLVDSILEC